MIDFNALVLGPAQDAFSRPVTYYPIKSQPGAPGFPARGIWAIKGADIQLDEGGVLGTDVLTLGVQGSALGADPMKGDRVDIPAHLSLPRVGLCLVDDDGKDGQGGFSLVLKIIGP